VSSIARPTVVIHASDAQVVAAKVSAYSLKSRSQHADLFDVRILRLEDCPNLYCREGQRFSWWEDSKPQAWRRKDYASFHLLRRMVPALMGYTGRALVIDPDVFAVGDVYDLLSRDMEGKAIVCRERPYGRNGRTLYSSAVMLLDCERLTSWEPEREIEGLFSGRLQLGPLIALLDVEAGEIGLLEEEWNDFDRLSPRTKLLHNTEVATQPWRTGLRSNHQGHVPQVPSWLAWPWLRAMYVLSRGRRKPLRHRSHSDTRQERLFFTLLDECVKAGQISTEALKKAVAQKYVRSDLFERLSELQVVADPARMGSEASGQ